MKYLRDYYSHTKNEFWRWAVPQSTPVPTWKDTDRWEVFCAFWVRKTKSAEKWLALPSIPLTEFLLTAAISRGGARCQCNLLPKAWLGNYLTKASCSMHEPRTGLWSLGTLSTWKPVLVSSTLKVTAFHMSHVAAVFPGLGYGASGWLALLPRWALGHLFSGDPAGKLEDSFCWWLARTPPNKINNPSHSVLSAPTRNTVEGVLQYSFPGHAQGLKEFTCSHYDLSTLAASHPLSHALLDCLWARMRERQLPGGWGQSIGGHQKFRNKEK